MKFIKLFLLCLYVFQGSEDNQKAVKAAATPPTTPAAATPPAAPAAVTPPAAPETAEQYFERIMKHPNWKNVDVNDCGVSSSDRIIGGKEAQLGQFPWIAQIGLEYQTQRVFFCGGALVTPHAVVSAAHCTELKVDWIRLGELVRTTKIDCNSKAVCAPEPQDIKPKNIFQHPDYDTNIVKNDIAVFILEQKAVINDFVRPICLPNKLNLFDDKFYRSGDMTQVAGWGVTNQQKGNTSVGDKLMFVSVPLLPIEKCMLKQYPPVDEHQICAGGLAGYDSCDGDSGGPLMKLDAETEGRPKYYIIGAVSFGLEKCAQLGFPAIYTRVAKYMDFVLDNIDQTP